MKNAFNKIPSEKVNFTIKENKICQTGTIDVKLKTIEIGIGTPKATIIFGIHGNETVGFFVLESLLKKLPQKINGTIQIIPCANPFALMKKERHSPIDQFDLNRIFPGREDGTITERLASKIIDICKGSDVVIDIHSFEMQTPLLGIVVQNIEEMRNKNIELMKTFSPKQCWFLEPQTKEEKQFLTCLGAELNKLSIPNIAVELSDHSIATDFEIEECSDGIIRVLENLKMINDEKVIKKESKSNILKLNSSTEKNNFNFFSRTKTTMPEEGIFLPMKKCFDVIEKNETIGKIIKVPSFEEIEVKSNSNGTLMQISKKKFLLCGEEVFAIGQKVKQ